MHAKSENQFARGDRRAPISLWLYEQPVVVVIASVDCSCAVVREFFENSNAIIKNMKSSEIRWTQNGSNNSESFHR